MWFRGILPAMNTRGAGSNPANKDRSGSIRLFFAVAVAVICWGGSNGVYAATLDSQLDSSIAGVISSPSFGFYQPLFGETNGHSNVIYGYTLAFSWTPVPGRGYQPASGLFECASPSNIQTETCNAVVVAFSSITPIAPDATKREFVYTFSTPFTLDPGNYYYLYSNGAYLTSPPEFYYGSTSGTHFYSGDDSTYSHCGTTPHERCPYSIYYQLFGVGGPDAPPADFSPATTTPPACTVNCNSNVLFLPGIEASRLYDTEGGERKLWEPHSDADAMQLAMTSFGTSIRNDIYTRDIIDNAYIPFKGNVYKSFIVQMNSLKSQNKIADWSAAPYDWRLSLDDILTHGEDITGNISYLTATDTPYIEQELRRLAATSRTGRVTIIAHSNGGLVAKALMQKLGTTTTLALIDKVILVASPQIGTPQGIAGLLHGHETALPSTNFPYSLSSTTARTLSDNMPGLYTLLPSASYFTYVDDPVITFSTTTQPVTLWAARYGDVIHSQERLHTFLTDPFRFSPPANNLSDPTILSNTMLSDAEAKHEILDTWVPPAGVQIIQIAGWGIPSTVSGIIYYQNGFGVTPTPRFTVDGDGTVVVPSALWMSTTPGTVNYWVNVQDWNDSLVNKATFGLFNISHANILELPDLEQFISDQITDSTKPLSAYTYLSTQAPISTSARLRYSLHSPLTLNLYDDQGRHTGISTTTGEVEEQIPGTYYMEFGEVKYIFTDASTTARIVMDGYAPGTFTFNVDQYEGDNLTASTTFKDIPTTENTIVSLDVQSDITTLSPMSIDKNGDGIVDTSIAPKLNDTVTLDTTPPEIRITFATSTHSLAFISIDDMGTTTITSTTTYPALKKHQKEARGIATTTVTVRDLAGNTTVLVYTEKLPSPDKRDTISLEEIAYNGATTTLSGTSVSYKWRTDKNGSYKLFASYIKTIATSTESHYRPKKDLTVIMTKPKDIDDSEEDDSDIRPIKQTLSGMVIPYIRTEEGRVIIGY
jgi:pimeloyl-ACP methyl ester carboxylesterase